MAPVAVSELHPALVTGYEVIQKGMAVTDIPIGALLVRDSATTPSKGHLVSWKLAPAGTKVAEGICLMGVKAGQTISVGIQGEMEGFTGLVPGARLYPSASVAGGIDTTVLTWGTSPTVDYPSYIRAMSTTGIYFNFA